MKIIQEEAPNEAVASEMFDELSASNLPWMTTLSTVAYLLAMIHAAGDKNRPSELEIIVAFPECKEREASSWTIKITEKKED